jgi:hypothetical protein
VLSEDDARDLALCVPMEWTESEIELLAPLVDAVIAWADNDVIEAIATPIAEELWRDSLREDLETALAETAVGSPHVRKRLRKARKDLAAGPRKGRVARAFLTQGAVERAFEEQEPIHCILCLQEALTASAPDERRTVALRVARMARRAASVPEAELRAAVATASFVTGQGDTAVVLATDERRRAVRAWLLRLAELGSTSIPALAAELHALVTEPFPAAADDDEIWHETVAGLIGALDASWN